MSQRCRGANGGAWCSHPAASNPLNASASTEASGPDAGRSAVISFSLRWAGTSPWYRILRSTFSSAKRSDRYSTGGPSRIVEHQTSAGDNGCGYRSTHPAVRTSSGSGLPQTQHVALRVLEIGEGTHTRNGSPGRDRRSAPSLDLLQSNVDSLDVNRDHRCRCAFVALHHAAVDRARLGWELGLRVHRRGDDRRVLTPAIGIVWSCQPKTAL